MSVTITDRRVLAVNDRLQLTVNEFDDGRAYILEVGTGLVSITAHFTGEQWAEFQKLIAKAER